MQSHRAFASYRLAAHASMIIGRDNLPKCVLLHELHLVLRELNNLLDKYATLVDAIGVIGSCIVDGFHIIQLNF
ncbi:hypothetical protein AAULH_01098 [Lactobacillus helveticus MTCC 5463]|nr:hypothetical protein AAULH_01098 [Lactobacillus helveticus MTCC 5463]